MKAKVINNLSDYYDCVIDVKLLNYKYIFGLLPDGYSKVKLAFEDALIIFDHEWEKSIIKYRDLLKMSLPQAATIKFYAAVCSAIEQYYKGDVKTISIMRDTNEKARKQYWYKRVEVVINEDHPAFISASGRDYKDTYNINIEDIDIGSFVCECKDGICNLKERIKKDIDQLKTYEKAISRLENPGKGKGPYKAIEGR